MKSSQVEITFENDSDSDFGGVDSLGGMSGGGGGGLGGTQMSTYIHYDNLEKERLDETVRQRMEQLGMKPKALNG